MKITGNKPTILSSIHTPSIKGNADILGNFKATVVDNMLVPFGNTPVTISHDGNPVDEDGLTQALIECFGDGINLDAEAIAKEVAAQTCIYFDRTANARFKELFLLQAGVKEKLPFPSGKVLYKVALDVQPAAKGLLAGIVSPENFFANLGYWARVDTLGFYFMNENSFDEFKVWFQNQCAPLGAILPPETIQMVNQFNQLSLKDLTESLLLRADDGDNQDEYCFARLIHAMLMQYTQVKPDEFGILPFSVPEVFNPKSIVFVNVERHASSIPSAIEREWKLIDTALNMPIKLVNLNKLSKLTAIPRNLQKAQGMAANQAKNNSLARAARVRFRKTEPSAYDITKMVKKIMAKMALVRKSENVFKQTKMTFNKPNRRDPDDFNKQGKIVSTKYKPDIHLYIDTSGSISESNYQASVKACIQMAKKLNVNLYFNSFSHNLSQCSHLKTKDKSLSAVYKEFQKIPKVSGGTDYEQIWHYINASKKRKREISLIITDFEWSAPNRFVKHPKNLYYIPCANMHWDTIKGKANDFCNSMAHIDPNCRKHLLF